MINNSLTHNDNRKYARLNETLPVRFRFSDRLDSAWQPAQTQNISEGGLFVESKLSPDSIGNIVHLDILLEKDSRPIRVICEVAWIKRAEDFALGIGLKIIQIEDKHKEAYLTYIYRKIPAPLKKKRKIKFLREPLYKLQDKERNCFKILDYIRRFGPVSKADISREINLNAVSVGKFVDEFLMFDIILDCGFGTSSGGRPAQLFKLNKDFGLILALEVNTKKGLINALVVNMNLEIIIEHNIHIDDKAKTVDRAVSLVSAIKAKLGSRFEKLIGIGIGIDRMPENSNLANYLGETFNIPVIREEDFHLESFAQSWLTRELSNKNILYIHSSHLLSLILDGDIYKPEKEIGGKTELSHMGLEQKALALIEFLGPDIVYIAKKTDREFPSLKQELSERLKKANIKETQAIKVLVSDIDEARVVALGAASLVMKEIFIGIC